MSGLVLKLGPKERILINGAVIENGDRRSRITVLTSKANILRLKDAIHPEDTNTPVRRACYVAQLLLSGDVEPQIFWDRLSDQVQTLSEILCDQKSADFLAQTKVSIIDRNAYACLKILKQLLPLEEKLLNCGYK